jgi:DNA-binding GntR family transcriptional regulator
MDRASLRMAPRPREQGPRGLRRQSLPEDLAAALRERILSGELPGGTLLRQEAVAEEYEVSRMPVREALRLLEGEGLVALQVHRGAIVTAHSPEQVGELFDLRAMLEADLLVRAVPLASARDLAHAEEVLRRVEAAYARNDAHAWGALNSEFHRALYLPARREQTLAIVTSIGLITERYIRLYHRIISAFAQAQSDHGELLALYRARKARQAGALLERHIQFTKQALVAALETRLAGPKGGVATPAPRRRRE